MSPSFHISLCALIKWQQLLEYASAVARRRATSELGLRAKGLEQSEVLVRVGDMIVDEILGEVANELCGICDDFADELTLGL